MLGILVITGKQIPVASHLQVFRSFKIIFSPTTLVLLHLSQGDYFQMVLYFIYVHLKFSYLNQHKYQNSLGLQVHSTESLKSFKTPNPIHSTYICPLSTYQMQALFPSSFLYFPISIFRMLFPNILK